MRHLCVSYHTCPLEEPGTALAGGMNVYLRGLLPALDCETLVLTSGERYQELALGSNVRVVRLPCRDPVWDREAAYRALPRFLELARQELAGPFDALSSHYWMSGLAARALFPGRPLAMMFHSLDPGRNPERAEAERELARVGTVIFSSSLDRAVSQLRLPELRRTSVIRPGVDEAFHPRDRSEARRRLGLAQPGPLVGLVARDDPAKNAPLARAACLEAGLPLLEVPGERWPGGLPHAEMPWFYAAVDVVLSVSDYETFGMSVLEALAAGCRVLVSERGYWGGVARHTGLLRVVRDLPRDLLRVLDEPVPDRTLIRRYFGWERAARRWMDVLRG